MNRKKCRAFGAIWAISQGLLSALLPQLSIKMIKKMIGKNFENADALEAKPEYKKQLRAIGIGMAAAGVASLVMHRVDDDGEDE